MHAYYIYIATFSHDCDVKYTCYNVMVHAKMLMLDA